MFKKFLLAILIFMICTPLALGEMPEPPVEAPRVLIGEAHGDIAFEAEFFYVTAGGAELTQLRREITIFAGEDPLLRVLEELLEPSGAAELVSVAPGETRVLDVARCGDFVTVNLSLDAAAVQSEAEILMMYTAITNTLSGIEGIKYVNVLIGARQERVCSLPTGVLSANATGATAMWAQYQAEAERLSLGGQIERAAAIYFPSANAQRVIPEIRALNFTAGEYALTLLSAIISGTDNTACVSFFSDIENVISAPPLIHVNNAGERVLDVYLTGAAYDTARLRGVEEWQIAASLVMTLTSFIPELDCVCLFVDGAALTEINIRGDMRSLTDGLMYRADFAAHVGAIATIYLSDGKGGLTSVKRAMSPARARSPHSLMLQLVSGPAPGESAFAAFPVGVSASDMLGVEISGGTAIVNLSANFYRLCQTLTREREAIVIYSIVNTLCSLDGVSGVKLLIEGRAVETLSDVIYLKSPLIFNPGIIK